MIKKPEKTVKISEPSKNAEKLNTILVENFVNLQKALTNLTIKFDKLSDQISSLLQLFEISAKSFAEKLSTGAPEIEKDREFLDKLNRLLDQNKVIAKGLTLMEEKLRERLYGTARPGTARNMPARRFLPPSYHSNVPQGEGFMPSSMKQEREEA